MPRAVLPGRCYLVTRRCSERRFFLRPDQATNNAFKYCLALAARKSDVAAIGLGVTSNHYHLVLVDKRGHLPRFVEHFHKLLAKHQNAHRGRWEAFWASEQTSVVELVKPEDVLAKLVYAIANPVSSHLVDKVHHWPGVQSLTAIDQDLPLVSTSPPPAWSRVLVSVAHSRRARTGQHGCGFLVFGRQRKRPPEPHVGIGRP